MLHFYSSYSFVYTFINSFTDLMVHSQQIMNTYNQPIDKRTPRHSFGINVLSSYHGFDGKKNSTCGINALKMILNPKTIRKSQAFSCDFSKNPNFYSWMHCRISWNNILRMVPHRAVSFLAFNPVNFMEFCRKPCLAFTDNDWTSTKISLRCLSEICLHWWCEFRNPWCVLKNSYWDQFGKKNIFLLSWFLWNNNNFKRMVGGVTKVL